MVSETQKKNIKRTNKISKTRMYYVTESSFGSSLGRVECCEDTLMRCMFTLSSGWNLGNAGLKLIGSNFVFVGKICSPSYSSGAELLIGVTDSSMGHTVTMTP